MAKLLICFGIFVIFFGLCSLIDLIFEPMSWLWEKFYNIVQGLMLFSAFCLLILFLLIFISALFLNI